MLIVFITMPIILGILYGGYAGQVANTDIIHCSNSNNVTDTNNNGTNILNGCLNYYNKPIKTLTTVAEQYYLRTPSSITTMSAVLFTISLMSFALNPHVLQRAFTAECDWDVKVVMICLAFTPFLCNIPGILTGISYISNFNGFTPAIQKMGAFQGILVVFRDSGGFKMVVSYIALIAAIAGIMSTADSALIGVSNTISVDIFQDWLLQGKSQKVVVWIGKLVSLITVGISIAFACYIQAEADKNKGRANYGIYLVIQQGILWQAFPAYLFGLYTKVKSKSILFGLIIGISVDLILVILNLTNNDPFVAIDPALSKLDKAWFALVTYYIVSQYIIIITVLY